MSFLTKRGSVVVNASAAATAWINAFHATGQDVERWVLYRTMGIEIYPTGVQFIATTGPVLFRTWVPVITDDGTAADWPQDEEVPESAVVVMDGNHFALAFIRALLSAAKSFEIAELSLTVEEAPEQDEAEEPPLGASFSQDVLTLRAFGQQLHCRLYEVPYVNWRALNFGLEQAERVDGMKVNTRMFQAVGKLRGVGAVDCTFTGGERKIILTGDVGSFRGLMMPMQRPKKDAPEPADEPEDEQTDALEGTTMSVNGGPAFPVSDLTKRGSDGARAVERAVFGGRDRAVGRDA